MVEKEMRGFEDLDCYKLALQVFREAYRVVDLLPPEEKYNLADQMRRAGNKHFIEYCRGIWALSLSGQPSFLLYCKRFHHGGIERSYCVS